VSGATSATLGTSGGVVAWSLVGAGITDQTGAGLFSGSSVALSSFLNFDYLGTLRAAFDAWASVANIEFIQVQDGGGNIGIGSFPTIRIAGGYMDGPSQTLAAAFFPSSNVAGGDMAFDSGETTFWTPHSFFLVALHEIGHALGLDHETANLAVMNPYYNSSLNSLQTDDISGMRAVYGAQDFGENIYYMPTSLANLTLLDAAPMLTVNGNASNNVITGTSAAETLNGAGGDDTLIGGGGNDVLDGGSGVDTVSFAFSGQGWTFDLTASYAMAASAGVTIRNFENVVGGAGDDTLIGTTGANVLTGGGGHDILNGGAGNDTMAGGAGNDNYYVDNAGDVVTENPNEGTDWVFSSGSYTLLDNVEWLTLCGAGTWTGVGNALDNNLCGNFWNNLLNGLGGTDFMAGGRGDDAYVIEYAGDIAYEAPGEGGDTVVSYVSLQLFSGSEIEALVLLDAGGTINGVGSDSNNLIQGNISANVLVGGKGDDQLIGRGGADRFVFMAGDGGDTISDFSHAEGDYVDLRVPGITSFADVQAHAVDHGGYTTLDFGAAGSVTLIGIHAAQLQANDFIFIV
jgi:Ca2+-binding RTX toxin-like protein